MDLEMQLRAAEARKLDYERAHAEAMAALRNCGSDLLESRQSRVRELEKKVALETVRCEELQLELSTSQKGRVPIISAGVGSTTFWGTNKSKGSEIERIMAKIEQDNRILAELEHSRSTTLGAGLQTSASSHALGESTPPVSPITMSHTTPSMYPLSNFCGAASNCPHQGPSPLSYLPSTTNYNPPISQYSSLGHPYTSTSKTNPITGLSTSGGGYHQISHQPLGTFSHIGSLVPSGLTGQTAPLNHLSQVLTQPSSNILCNSTILPPPVTYTTNSVSMHLSSNLPQTVFSNTYTNPVTSSLPQYSLPYNPITTTGYSSNVTFSNPLSSQYNPLTAPVGMSIKLKPYEEVELGRRPATPVTPHPTTWNLGPALGITDTRPLSRLMPDGLDSEWSGLHSTDRSYLNGHSTDGQVDMLDIPGKGRCSVYIARFSYDPELEAEEELSVQAGDYLLVWGESGGSGGYLDAETLDGRRGLVPSHFAQRLIGDDLLEFHQAVLTTLREEEISAETFAADIQRLNEIAEMSEGQEDDNNDGDAVPAPRNLTLERQLNKSVLIGWTSPENIGPGNQIESYHVYVDGVLKTTIKAAERTRALVEGVDSNRPHRISVRSVTANRRTSRDAACTMIIGRDTHQLGPSAVRATNVTATSAIISWLPSNSNHQHVVCVNNVEVRTVKPGVYRHTITGLTPNTQYRVTVRAKHHRAAQNVANLTEDPPMPAAAHTDFRTLPKGLPDPPSDIMVEPGPQDGTLLVTWHPVQPPHHPGSVITGYSVYADGKKVTDVDSPTGDHALIDISKLLGLNPRHVTVKTKARDSQSVDSVPTPIPVSVLRGGVARARQQPHSAVPMHMRQPQGQQLQQQQQRQPQVIEHDENLSDKEIFPTTGTHRAQTGIPAIAQRSIPEITKESFETNLSEDELQDRRSRFNIQQQRRPQQRNDQQQPQTQYYPQQPQQGVQQQRNMARNVQQTATRVGNPAGNPNVPPTAQKRARWFVALFDYDPSTMSPNPDACEEELPFTEGDTIKVWGDKDADGFYWGECRSRRGYVPHNMVMEVEGGNQNRDRWGDIYASLPVKKMVALYDYDPQELSPNVDAEVELSFTTGQIISVYGEMDDDGFYMAEIEGARGLVPSNFLTEAPDQYSTGVSGQTSTSQQARGQRGRGHGPGARGPPPPPRENTARPIKRDACPVLPSQLDNATNTATPNTQVFTEHQVARARGK